MLPWLKGKAHRELQVMRDYLRVAFHRVPIAADRRNVVERLVHEAIALPARWRLDHGFYKAPVELWMKDRAKRMFAAPKPKVDAHQLEAEVVTC